MIRLIATDLDGTLLSSASLLSDRTRAAIEAAADAGIEVIAATGRSFRTADWRLSPAPQVRTLVASNGGLVYDLASARIEATYPIAGDLARTSVAELRSHLPDLQIGWETEAGFGFEPEFDPLPGDSAGDPSLLGGPQTFDEVRDAIKLFVAHPEIEHVELQEQIVRVLPAELNGATSGARFLEVTAATVDKGTTVAAVAAQRGYGPEQVLAMGDQMNDEAMLRWAGTAVAMGNGRPEIKALADVVAPPVDEDGAAQIIEAVTAGQL